jgi:hypothetical protein
MKTFNFIQGTIPHNLKDPHSKALERDCLSPFGCDYDTVSRRERVGVRVKTNSSPSPESPPTRGGENFLFIFERGRFPWPDY